MTANTTPAAWSYQSGDWFGIFGTSTTLLLPGSERGRVVELWSLIDEGAEFAQVLDRLLSSGLSGLVGFVLVGGEGDSTRVILRGEGVSATLVADGVVELDGAAGSTWVEHTASGVTGLSVVVSETADGGDYPIEAGLVRVSRVDRPAPLATADASAVSTLPPPPPPLEPPLAAQSVAVDPPSAPPAAPESSDYLSMPPPPVPVPVPVPVAAPSIPAPPVVPPSADGVDDIFDADDADQLDSLVEPVETTEPEVEPEPESESLVEPVETTGNLDEPSPLDEASPFDESGVVEPEPEPETTDAEDELGTQAIDVLGSDEVTNPPPVAPSYGGWPMPDAPAAPVVPATPAPAASWSPDAGFAAPAPAPDAGPPSLDHDGLTQAGVNPHEFARPQSGIPGQPQAPSVTRPVAQLVISNGENVLVDRVVLIGRAPEARRFTATEQPLLITVPSPLHEISSTHIEVRPGSGVDHGSAVVTDMGSTNGTVVVQPGLGPEDLKPGIAVQLIPGAVINLGDGVTIQVNRP